MTKLKSVHFRHHDVKQDNVRRIFMDLVERFFARRGDRHFVAQRFHHARDNVSEIAIILSNKDSKGVARRRLCLFTWRRKRSGGGWTSAQGEGEGLLCRDKA